MDKKRIIVTEKQLKEILNEYDSGNFEIAEDAQNDLVIKFVGREEIRNNADLIWDMLVLSYEDIGGLKTYKSKLQFINMAKYAKIVYSDSNIVACAIYRKMEDSYKMVAIGCNQEEDGKRGIQEIIKSDIYQIDCHYWAEVSGAIEHYFKKYNGYPMPNVLASEILKIDEKSLRLSTKDKVHYERIIAEEWYEKMIFGIKNEEIYQEAIKAVDDYSNFMRNVNNLSENDNYGNKYTLKQAIYIIENILRAHQEDNFNELVPSWYQALVDSKNTLLSLENTEMIEDYLEYCDYLLNNMTILELKELDI